MFCLTVALLEWTHAPVCLEPWEADSHDRICAFRLDYKLGDREPGGRVRRTQHSAIGARSMVNPHPCMELGLRVGRGPCRQEDGLEDYDQ